MENGIKMNDGSRTAPDLRLSGCRVLVTAGAGGCGLVISRTLSDLGASVMACDIDAARAADLQEQRSDICTFVGDVSDEGTVERLFSEAEHQLGGIDVLVNNVGIAGPTAEVEAISNADWNRTIATNLTSHFLCVRRAVPGMKSRRDGLIVSISSGSARTGLPLRLPYVVSKVAVLGMTSNLARELGPHGIRVNSILPGPIRGERMQRVIGAKAQALGKSPQDYESELLRYVSLRCMVEPEDIAAMVAFLASSAGRHISGQHIGVDGNQEYEE
jgi:NAD(P)-dependent dehydrogenase (short-subunit alcohol dehydrogenase family)